MPPASCMERGIRETRGEKIIAAFRDVVTEEGRLDGRRDEHTNWCDNSEQQGMLQEVKKRMLRKYRHWKHTEESMVLASIDGDGRERETLKEKNGVVA